MQSTWELEVNPTRFKALFSLDTGVACLNHGMLGACPIAVQQRQSALRAQMERQPAAFVLRALPGLLDDARQALAELVGADPQDLLLLPNVTTAMSAVLRSRTFAPGDQILTTDHAYLSCSNLLDFIARSTGAEVVLAQVEVPVQHPDEIVDAVLEQVTPRTRLAVLDHVTSPSAIVFPIAVLVERLAALGIDTLVDGAHAPGMLPLDVSAIGAAYYAGDCHKWLCAPRGAGFLHVRRDRQEGLHPPVISRGYGDATQGRPRLHLEFDWLGTADPTALLCIPAAIEFLAGLLPGGLPAVYARNHALVTQAATRLARALPLTRLAPDAMVGSMVAFQLPDVASDAPDAAAAALQRWLYDAHRIDVAVTPWPHRSSRTLRISAQVYNTVEDFMQLETPLARCFAADDRPLDDQHRTAETMR
ncbi:aminotransferase class V-fold PLP-dependent enzyme [Xanthomonas hortorum pv. pelargonii]|nr:aminotransferase class V-fold PLP-dependent enzyme [Xanthomonas hortorum]MCE4354161.1 aminotransferase class V-fold PLP-dependent enzyme [Xanthomonas hortorum pv. pelargonii]MCM5523642.1 aminotransferase class V-fold PLP-dependent enzyme [Xanthomonas hortorum pv. pelargonii]MCM5534820.1 aminotransferase class V-fold PLP-dependent enzyme [Xanthomonas hortorum pv. pelargonii]MCM5540993.1 aminotransferase class V-fold PLP-dependent enzyme [Xanthomonas hortorum pv. pelargonii]MCM5544310.1 amino